MSVAAVRMVTLKVPLQNAAAVEQADMQCEDF
jgi:hypothetical protein